MKYLRISNVGEIEPNAFKLIGASTKRGDAGKIGFFGSGLKYAMAYLLRNGVQFTIFSGNNEVVVSTKSVNHRDQAFDVIQIDGEDTSMTTEMGPKWTSWGMLREIYCNAIDEGEDQITVVDESSIGPVAGQTLFYIRLNADLVQIVDNWDMYFSQNRQDVVHCPDESMSDFGKLGKIMWPRPDDIFIVYRKGIQCHLMPQLKSCFHYDMPWININESREIDEMYRFQNQLTTYFEKHAPTKVIKALLECMDKEEAEFEYDLSWYGISRPSNAWEDAIGKRTVVAREISGWFADRISADRANFLLLPMSMVGKIQKTFPDISVLGENTGQRKFVKIERTEKQKFLLDEAKKFFDEAGYVVEAEVHVVKFSDSHVLGHMYEDTIFVSDQVFTMGKRKLVEVIYEENEHLKTKFDDETRAFQNHLISQVITCMEEKYAYFL